MIDSEQRLTSFKSFWPYYVREHLRPINRALHVFGTSAALLLAVAAVVAGEPKLWIGVPVVGYGCAWVGHFFFEHNRPATFQYPLYSLLGDFYMLFHVVTGRMGRELERFKPRNG